MECETSSRPLSSEAAAAVITPYENHHKNEEEEDLKKEIDEGESCDGYDTEAIRLSQKRSAAALIDEVCFNLKIYQKKTILNNFLNLIRIFYSKDRHFEAKSMKIYKE